MNISLEIMMQEKGLLMKKRNPLLPYSRPNDQNMILISGRQWKSGRAMKKRLGKNNKLRKR
jgi:hypothetical protein